MKESTNWEQVQKYVLWREEVFALWDAVEANSEYKLPEGDKEKIKFFAKILRETMAHNAEKNRDPEGERFYSKLESIIRELETKS